MATRPCTPVEHSSENVEKLQIPASFSGYVAGIINGKSLANYTVKQKVDGSVSVILTYHMERNKGQPLGRHLENKSSKPAFKRKSPSRRRRDRERFRLFLERKKARRVQNAVSKQPSVAAVQCPPPSELTVPAHNPPTITLDQPPTAGTPLKLHSPQSRTLCPYQALRTL